MKELQLKVNQHSVAYEVQEGRAIVVNVKSGSYYDLDLNSTVVWLQLSSSDGLVVSVNDGIDAGAPCFVGIEQDKGIAQLLHYLLLEGLIVCFERSEVNTKGTTPLIESMMAEEVFGIQKYQDMELFLRLDPILAAEGAQVVEEQRE